MSYVVRAFPLLPGKEDTFRRFAQELRVTKARETRDFFARYGVRHESWHLQTTPNGQWVIVVTDISQRPVDEVASDYASSAADFDVWFKSQVKEISGIDPDEQPLGPPTECAFEIEALR